MLFLYGDCPFYYTFWAEPCLLVTSIEARNAEFLMVADEVGEFWFIKF